MARLGRKCRVLKWAGLILLLLIVVAWAVSLRWAFGWNRLDDSRRYHSSAIFQIGALYVSHLEYLGEDASGLYWAPDNFYPEFLSIPRILLKPDFWFVAYPNWSLVLPLWIPFVLIAIPTAALWWRDRRRIRPGCCRKCGYNLTGNVSGVCPECGEKVDAQVAPKG
jgi:hypothetical protein